MSETVLPLMQNWPSFDVQGHRGARGLLPENSVQGFVRAMELGATTLEMDVVISRDRQVVVSHDLWFSSEFCLLPSGAPISAPRQYDYRIFEMPYEQVKRFDCGRPNRRFMRQVPVPSHKPLLSEVVEQAEAFAQRRGAAPPRYSIEIKSRPESDDVLHPHPEEFASLLMKVLLSYDLVGRSIIQSFDPRPLRIVRDEVHRPLISFLVSAYDHLGVEADVRILGFLPEVYSPSYRVATRRTIAQARARGMKVVPWTVNRPQDIARMIELGADGLITDYPDVAVSLI